MTGACLPLQDLHNVDVDHVVLWAQNKRRFDRCKQKKCAENYCIRRLGRFLWTNNTELKIHYSNDKEKIDRWFLFAYLIENLNILYQKTRNCTILKLWTTPFWLLSTENQHSQTCYSKERRWPWNSFSSIQTKNSNPLHQNIRKRKYKV